MIIGCMLEPSWPIGSFHESLLQYQRHEPPLVQPIPIIGAIHSACIAVSIDILNWWTAGLVLSATHKRPNGAFRASCIRQRQVMIFQILLNNGFGMRSKSFIFSASSSVTMANLVHGWSPWLNGEGKGASFFNQSSCFLRVSHRSAGYIANAN